MNIRDTIQKGAILLKSENIESPKLKARMVMQFVLKKSRQYIIVNDMQELSREEEDKYFENIEKLRKNIPIEYITNQKEFMKLDFFVNENVLIPRQDTEILVEEVIQIAKKIGGNKILDLCTGSGAIAVSLAKYVENSKITAVDISKDALQVAKKNAIMNGVKDQITFVQSDIFENVKEEKFDIIVSNPPYIKRAELNKLEKQVQKEPTIALDGGEDGLEFYRKIAKQSGKYLKENGYLCMEIGYDQKNDVIKLLLNTGMYENIHSKRDLYGNDRVVVGKMSNLGRFRFGQNVQNGTVPEWTKCPKRNRPRLDILQGGIKVMSFSSDIKQELSKLNTLADKKQVKYELIGYLLTSNATNIENRYLRYATESEYNINRFSKLLENLSINHQIEMEGNTFVIKCRIKDINFTNKSIDKDIDIECKKAVVRGAFLGAGSISNPENCYHLEIIFSADQYLEWIRKILKEDFEIHTKKLDMQNKKSVYVKDGEEISKILALMGAHRGMLKFEDIRVQKEMRGKVNRIVNCETANLNKTINAAVDQIEAIKKLQRENRFNKLDDNLKEIANLRLENPDMSLAELGKNLKNPIGKSGVNYRLKKIIEIANLEMKSKK